MTDLLRFRNYYPVPHGRPKISSSSLENNYRIEKVLDSGKGGPDAIGGCNNGVYLVRHRQSGKLRVEKRIPVEKGLRSLKLEREILLLEVLQHPNIMGFADAYIVPRHMSLYMEYCDLGSLHTMIVRYLHHQQPPSTVCVPEAFIWHILHSLASALQYLHWGIDKSDSKGPPGPKFAPNWYAVLHRDIKPDNILFRTVAPPPRSLLYPHWPCHKADPEGSRGVYPKVVLADFGLATQHDEPDFPSGEHYIGTPAFSPPESPMTKTKGDIWATGASIISLCRLLPFGPVPEPPRNCRDEIAWYRNPEIRRDVGHMSPGPAYSQDLGKILRATLAFDRHKRPSSWQLMNTVRVAEQKLFLSERRALPVVLLPPWACGK